MIKTLVENFLYDATRGESKLSPSVIEEFKEACGKALEKQFNEKREWRMRMSGLGKPLCQQQLEQKSIKGEIQYNTIMKFLLGDLIEALAIAVMRGSGVNIETTQKPVKLKIGDIELGGTYDVKIDGKVWDVKSASPSSFLSKFGEFGGYQKIKSDDPFGYVTQGHLYGEAENVPFGGWIAINKATGEWAICEAPEMQQDDRHEVLERTSSDIKKLRKKNTKFKKLFEEVPEMYTAKSGKNKGQKMESGNTMLTTICGYCQFRKHCWPKSIMHEKVTSKAKTKPLVWYNKLINEEPRYI